MSRPSSIHSLALSVPILFLKEKKTFIAYTPVLDLSASGSTVESAKKNFERTLKLFIDELVEAGTLPRILKDLGWTKHEQEWQPPLELKTVAFLPVKVSVPA